MDAEHSRTREWIRRLSARGLPPGDVAFVLAVPASAVEHTLAVTRARADRVRRYEQCRQMRDRGMSLEEIGRSCGVAGQVVWYWLKHPPELPTRLRPVRTAVPPLDASRGIRSDAGTRVRRLLALGHGAARIAELMELDPSDVADFAGRLEGPAGRVRPRRRPSPRSSWEGDGPEYRDDDDLVRPVVPATAAAELPRVEALGVELPAPSADVGPWEANWGREPARGGRNARAALDDVRAAEVRTLRAQGISRAELAERFGVSVATVTRITSGRTYADPPADVAPLPCPAGDPAAPMPG